jgi:hypothetical protein
VKAAEPVEVLWSFANVQTVGQDVEVTVKALDDRGLLCAHYDDQYLIHIRGPISHDVIVRLTGGQALVRLNHTKAETWSLSLQYSGAKKVKLPDSRQIEWQPGVATRLVLDGPTEYLAGDQMKVQVVPSMPMAIWRAHFRAPSSLKSKPASESVRPRF